MSRIFEIWCDGSYRSKGHLLGTAWVTHAPDGSKTNNNRTHPRLQDCNAHGSDIAELSAFIDALGTLPDNAQVRVHMDCKNVINWLTTGRIGSNDKWREARIRRTFESAVRAKNRMRNVEIVHASDKSSENMGLAHILSRTATAPEGTDLHAYQNSQPFARPRHA